MYVGDCIKIMRSWPAKSIGAVVTDPVWPYCKVKIAGRERPFGLFQDACREFARLTDILIVHIGCMTDVRLLKFVPASLPFRRVCWLRKVPCVGRGLAPGETTGTFQQADFAGAGGHPCPRNLKQVMWLVHWFTPGGGVLPVLDPFAGSGTTLLAAEKTGRSWVGIEINPEYAKNSEARIVKERSQIKMDFTRPLEWEYRPTDGARRLL